MCWILSTAPYELKQYKQWLKQSIIFLPASSFNYRIQSSLNAQEENWVFKLVWKGSSESWCVKAGGSKVLVQL